MSEEEVPSVLVTICARGGSKGVPGKNIRPLLGKPLIGFTIELAQRWRGTSQVVVSTDCPEIASVAKGFGASVPFRRPTSLATDTAGKMPVIIHALQQSENHFGQVFDFVLDLDPTAPIRTLEDLESGWKIFRATRAKACFSVVKARKNPYFNMVERNKSGRIALVKALNAPIFSRQSAPQVWDMNASAYFFTRNFLKSNPSSLWESEPEVFEMPPISAFDIDEERDFVIVEALMRHAQ